MQQKDRLKQDMFLIGTPGATRRRLALRYCQRHEREFELLTLSRDTTEADLKQRREIIDKNVTYEDQAPVRAAVQGKILIVDGIEKAERNVLPTLNNLLENREMHLDDGRFLMAPRTYDDLLSEQKMTDEEMHEKGFVRVHENFRVVALGLPVPPFRGRSLDPPLRSRFQARAIGNRPIESVYESLVDICNGDRTRAQALTNLVASLRSLSSSSSQTGGANMFMPPFPEDALEGLARSMTTLQHQRTVDLVLRYYPVHLVRPDLRERVEAIVNRFFDERSASSCSSSSSYHVREVVRGRDGNNASGEVVSHDPHEVTVTFRDLVSDENRELTAACGRGRPRAHDEQDESSVVFTPTFVDTLTDMSIDHTLGQHLCVIGPAGSGKSKLTAMFAERFGYDSALLFPVFRDMSARDLWETRATNERGDTTWRPSALIRGAQDGNLVILDGIHRLHPDVISSLSQLLSEGFADLPSGKRVYAHPSFRVVALAEPPLQQSSSTEVASWLNAETLALPFAFNELRPLVRSDVEHMLSSLHNASDLSPASVSQIARLFETLNDTHDRDSSSSTSPRRQEHHNAPISLRQLLRLSRREAAASETSSSLRAHVHSSLLTAFAPVEARERVDRICDEVGVAASMHATRDAVNRNDVVRVDDNEIVIDGVKHRRYEPSRAELVPRPLYFDNPLQTRVMGEMLRHMNAGDRHFLMIGNQGVGKNKVADRLLQLLRKEREYIQLHRDTTIQSLTLSPSLIDGRIVWEDSPLVRAVIHGHTLLVDEADKAPLEVVCVLKSLVEDGEMTLADGRRLLHHDRFANARFHDDNAVEIHPDFSMWVLANRPGYVT